MAILFEDVVFGPIKSRRFGKSLGINLLPLKNKVCNFNCIYCECGWTDLKSTAIEYLTGKEILEMIEARFIEIRNQNVAVDCITFAGNGEPTMHPDFDEIIDGIITLRNKYLPGIKIAVLSNSALLGKAKVFKALQKIDLRVMKLDAGSEDVFNKINKPLSSHKLTWYIDKLKEFNGDLIIQSIFLKGICEGEKIDNTRDEEVKLWLKALKEINPRSVMIYSLDRETPAKGLEKISIEKLNEICKMVRAMGLKAEVYS